MLSKQNQQAGDDSTNVQVQGNMTVVMGIDEKRAREIYKEMSLQLREDYSQEALNIAKARVEQFEDSLMPKMEAVEGALEAFADPSFQLLMVEAQKTAASTERVADYDLLSELLVHRFQKGENRKVRAGISRAVEIVDEIADDALLGLTVYHSVSQFLPLSGDIHQGLNVLNNLFEKLFYDELPSGNDWVDHLDILDAARLNSLSNVRPIQQIYTDGLYGYVDVGIKKGSENHERAIEILKEQGLNENILVKHAFDNDYVRLNVPNKESLKSISINRLVVRDGAPDIKVEPITESEIEALEAVYALYEVNEQKKQANISAFMVEWDERPSLKALRTWWSGLALSLQITAVGRVLAHSNAQRRDKSLPPLS